MNLRLSVTLLPLALAACASDSSTPIEPGANVLVAPCAAPAPLLGAPDSRIADSYVIVFTDAITDSYDATAELAERHGFAPKYVYDYALEGFAAVLSAETVAAVRCEPIVDFVEHDAVMQLDVE